MLGFPILAATLAITAVALVTGGGRRKAHQPIDAALAIAVTFTIGRLIGGHSA